MDAFFFFFSLQVLQLLLLWVGGKLKSADLSEWLKMWSTHLSLSLESANSRTIPRHMTKRICQKEYSEAMFVFYHKEKWSRTGIESDGNGQRCNNEVKVWRADLVKRLMLFMILFLWCETFSLYIVHIFSITIVHSHSIALLYIIVLLLKNNVLKS